jgi:hypothetical protein
MKDRTLEQDIVIALRDFKVYLRHNRIQGRNLAVRLRFFINDWLAQPVRVTEFRLTARPPHEVAELVNSMESDFRTRWAAKASETRSKKKNPNPKDDKRNLILI